MALPARPFRAIGQVVVYPARHFCVCDLGKMAPYTIVLHGLNTGRFHFDRLGFQSQRKYGCVIEPVFGFKIVFVYYIVLGNMAIIAGGNFAVGTVLPGDILWGHYMAVDAGAGILT